jgi:hypothetical protein
MTRLQINLIARYKLSLKNGPRYNFAIDDPSEKKNIGTGNEMVLKPLQT